MNLVIPSPKKLPRGIMEEDSETDSVMAAIVEDAAGLLLGTQNEAQANDGDRTGKVGTEDSMSSETASVTKDNGSKANDEGLYNYELIFYPNGVIEHDPSFKPFIGDPRDFENPKFGQERLRLFDLPEKDKPRKQDSTKTVRHNRDKVEPTQTVVIPEGVVQQAEEEPMARGPMEISNDVRAQTPVPASTGGTPQRTFPVESISPDSGKDVTLDTPPQSDKERSTETKKRKHQRQPVVDMDQIVKYLESLRADVKTGIRHNKPRNKCLKRLQQFEETFVKWTSPQRRVKGDRKKAKSVLTSSKGSQAGCLPYEIPQ